MTNYNDGKWHGWNGGECPVHRQSIGDLTYYDGTVYTDVKMSAFGWQEPLMFRVTKGYKEPSEFWEKDGRRFYDVKSAILSAGDAEIIHWCEVNEDETEEEDLVTLIEDAPEDDLHPCLERQVKLVVKEGVYGRFKVKKRLDGGLCVLLQNSGLPISKEDLAEAADLFIALTYADEGVE